MKRAVLFSVLLATICFGCTSPGSQDVSGSGGGAEVKLIILQDGTKCAILVGYNKGAISCDWRVDKK